MEEVNHVEANSVQINGTAPHEDNTPNGTHEDKKLIEKSEKSTTEEPSTKAEAAPAPVQKPKLSNVEIANLSKELDKLSKYNLKDIVVQILKSFPETESPVREQIKTLSAPRTPRQATPRKTPVSTPRATNNNNNTQSSPSRPSTSRSTASSNPNLFSAGPTAKRVTVFLAGQELKNGQVILINQGRTFQQFVDDVTNKFKFINNNIKIYSYPAANLIQNIEELDSGMQLLAALPNQKPTIQTAPSSPRKTTSSPAKTNFIASPAKSNAPPPVSVAPRRSDPGPISNRNNNNNAGSAPKKVYQPKTPTKQPSEPKETTKPLTPSSSGEKKVMVRGPVQREVVTNPQKNVSVKDLIGAAKNSPPAKSGWIVPQKNQAQPTQPEQTQQSEVPANSNNNSTDVTPAQPAESRPEPVQQEAPVQQKLEQPAAPAQPPKQPEPVQQEASEVKQPSVPAQAAETKPEPAAPVAPVVQQEVPVQQKLEQPAAPAQQEVPPQREAEKPEESVPAPESPSKVEPRAAVVVTSPEPKSDTQIAKDLDSKLLEVMNRRRMEQQQKQSS